MDRYPCATTIGNWLRRHQFQKFKLKKKHLLEPWHKSARLEFANKWLLNGEDTLGNVIWTDETRVASHPNNRHIFEWSSKNNDPNAFIQIKKHSGGISVMFWGCISKHGPGPLVSLDKTMNGEEYIKTLRESLLPELKEARRLFPGTWRVQQDNAPCHTAKAVKDFCAKNNVEFIKWPAYSPDLNPIENIWAWIKHQLDVFYPPCKTENDIIERVGEIWGTITPEMCYKYCGNYKNRLQAVKDQKGSHTKY